MIETTAIAEGIRARVEQAIIDGCDATELADTLLVDALALQVVAVGRAETASLVRDLAEGMKAPTHG